MSEQHSKQQDQFKLSANDWCRDFITDQDCEKIEAAVSHAESKTSGEIVPVIVSRSSTAGQAGTLLFFILFSLALVIEEICQTYQPHSHFIIIIVGLLLWPLSVWLARSYKVQRLLCLKEDLQQQVMTRAELEFFRCHVNKTQDRAAILIFVSLFERQAIVLADQKIGHHLPPETWQEIVNALIVNVREGKAGDGFVAAIEKSGIILAEHFPRQSGDRDELHNHLTIKI